MLSIGAYPLESIGLYAPSSSTHYLRFSNTTGYADTTFSHGQPGGTPLAADCNADDMDTIALYDGQLSRFSLRNSNSFGPADAQYFYGEEGEGWKPIMGDWDGAADSTGDKNCCTAGLYDPSTSIFYLRNSNDTGVADTQFGYGPAGQDWVPLCGDWDADGIDTIGLYDPRLSKFHLRNTNGPRAGDPNDRGYADIEFSYGRPSNGDASKDWIPIAGDWDADGTDTVALYDPTTSGFYLRNSLTTGCADLTFGYGEPGAGWLPIAGRWLGQQSLQVSSPNGGETWQRDADYEITWRHTASSGSNVQIELYSRDAFQGTIASSTPSDDSYIWHIPSTTPLDTQYQIKVTSISDPSCHDSSNRYFSVTRDQQFPDLVLRDSQVSLGRVGDSLAVNATVHNEGSADVTDSILVRFREVTSGATIGTATISGLARGERETVSTVWSPSAGGAVLEICVDPYDTVRESSNLNNVARVVSGGVGTSPVVQKVTRQYDDKCRFISGIQAMNTVTASVTDPDGNSDVDYVTLSLGNLPPVRDADGSDGWSVSLDMGQLSGDSTLSVVAFDKAGNSSAAWTESITVIPLPSWADAERCLFVGGDRPHYELSGWTPEDWRLEADFPKSWRLIGGLENGFQAGLLIHAFVGLDGVVVPDKSDYFLGARFTVFGQELSLFDLSEASAGATFYKGDAPSWVPNRAGFGFEFEGLEPTFDSNLEIKSVDLDLNGSVDFNYKLWQKKWSNKNPKDKGIFIAGGKAPFTVGGWPMSFEMSLYVTPGFDWAVHLGIGDADNPGGIGIFQPETSITPNLGVALKAKVNLVDAGVFRLGVYVKPSFTFSYDLGLLDAEPGFDDRFSINFMVDVGAEATFWRWTKRLGQVTVAGPYPLVNTTVVTGMNVQSAGDSQLGILATPDVVTMPDGRQLRVYVPEDEGGDAGLVYEILNGTEWSTPAPIASNAGFCDASPRLAANKDGTIALVWTRVNLTQQELEVAELDEILAAQEICYARFDGANWSAPVSLTNNTQSDGNPVLAYGPDGRGLAMWVTSADDTSTHGAGDEIAYATWNGSAWGPPTNLTANAVGDRGVDFAYMPDGTAVAAWLRDVAVDPDSRLLQPYYAVCSGSAWSAPEPIPGIDGSDIPSIRVASLTHGRILIVWTEAVEGGFTLRSTVRSATGRWSAPETIATGLPTVDGLQLEVNDNDTAFAFFHGTGLTDEIICVSRNFRQAGATWTSPAPVSDGQTNAWQPAGTITANGDLFVTWANAPSSPDLLGHSLVAAGPDLDFAADSLSLAGPSIHTGDQVRLCARVVNLGHQASETSSVRFSYVGETPQGTELLGVVPVAALLPDGTALVQSPPFNLPEGTDTYYATLVRSEETEADNITVQITVESTAPDVAAPTVVLTVPSGGVRPGTQSLTLRFSEAMSALTESDLSLVGVNSGVLAPDRVWLNTKYDTDPIYDEATLWFEEGIPPDTYRLKVFDSVEDTAANPLDGDNDGASGGDYSANFVVAPGQTTTSPLWAADGQASSGRDVAPLAGASLGPIVAQAIARWAGAGLSRDAMAAMHGVQVKIADLPGAQLGAADAGAIYIDPHAAGHGWFVDHTPSVDEEFAPSGSEGQLRAIAPQALDRIDLLSVVEHELGHTVGLKDLDESADDLMSIQLGMGTRRMPGASDIDSVLRDLG